MSKILLEVNGVRYDGWTEVTVSKSIENLCGSFDFSTTVKESAGLVIQNDLKAQDEVKIFIDDTLILTGNIESLSISYSTSDHSIRVSGRDKTGDLIDSSIVQKNYKQTNFIKLATAILTDNGYSSIKILNKIASSSALTVGATPSNGISLEIGEQPTTDQGETIASCLSKYASKIQALLITDNDGNINVTTEGSSFSAGDLVSGGGEANILSASIEIDTTDRFRYVEVYSQSNNDADSKHSINQIAIEEDAVIRNPRRKRISVPTASKSSTLKNLAKWNVNIKRAKGMRYSCTVQDFYASKSGGAVWLPNTLVQVKDERCQIDGQFLIQGVTYKQGIDGSFTDLAIVEKGAFSVEPETESTGSTGKKKGKKSTKGFAGNLFADMTDEAMKLLGK